MKKSMIETAWQILSQHEGNMPFIELWNDVAGQMGYTVSQADDNIAQFYTDLSIDNRFLNLPGNHWDLKSRHTYSENVLDTDSIALDEDGDDEEDEEILLEEDQEKKAAK